MNDLLSKIAAAQRDAGERAVMEDLKAKGFDVEFLANAGIVGSAGEHDPDCGCPVCDDSNRGNR